MFQANNDDDDDRLLDAETQAAQMEANESKAVAWCVVSEDAWSQVLKKNIDQLVPRVNAGSDYYYDPAGSSFWGAGIRVGHPTLQDLYGSRIFLAT